MSVGWVTAGDSDGSGMALRPATAGESEESARVVEEAEDEGAETWVAPTKLNTKQQGKGKAWGKRPWQVKEEEDSSNWSSWGASNTRDWRKKGSVNPFLLRGAREAVRNKLKLEGQLADAAVLEDPCFLLWLMCLY
eukprot:s1247_g10.t1